MHRFGETQEVLHVKDNCSELKLITLIRRSGKETRLLRVGEGRLLGSTERVRTTRQETWLGDTRC